MPRMKVFEMGVINVVTHPHSEEQYVEIFERLSKQKITAPAGEGHRCQIKLFHKTESHTGGVKTYSGQFCRFQHLDDWDNDNTGKPATAKDLEDLDIPDHLIPGMRRFEFVFFPNIHRLCYEVRNEHGKTMSPGSFSKWLTNLFDRAGEDLELEEINIQPQVEHESIEEIFKIPNLQSLKYTNKLPNPDLSGNSADARIEKRLKEQNVREARHELKGTKIAPDQQTKDEVEAAAHNGHVLARGKMDDNSPKTINTTDHPMKLRVEYTEQQQTRLDALKQYALTAFTTIKSRLNRNTE